MPVGQDRHHDCDDFDVEPCVPAGMSDQMAQFAAGLSILLSLQGPSLNAEMFVNACIQHIYVFFDLAYTDRAACAYATPA